MMGCTPKGGPVLEGGVAALVIVGGNTTIGCPTTKVFLVLDVAQLTTITN